jgi:ribosomal protein L16 Arg81 hydroxylase
MLSKNFLKLQNNFDFNFLSTMVDSNNFITKVSSNCHHDLILETVFKIQNVEKENYFKELFNYFNEKLNINKKRSDLYIFFSLMSGTSSITHRDNYDVYILGLFGKTLIKIENNEFIVEPGDLLYIEKNKLHKAIGITPRITLSYGMYDN